MCACCAHLKPLFPSGVSADAWKGSNPCMARPMSKVLLDERGRHTGGGNKGTKGLVELCRN